MIDIIKDVEVSLAGLYVFSGALLCMGLFFVRKVICKKPLYLWKNIIGVSFVMSVLNAGIVILIGQKAFVITPIIVVVSILIAVSEKITLPELKFILGFNILFVLFSSVVFLGGTGIFFHLAIEGKIN
ncbi:MAG: hypothetical protein HON90_09940 [Halobacteriovoraceae bacterium]|jgi:hypothetical protein|nr:hypothetical protein [Halobacteriovoraceae bacterium]